MAKSIPVIPGPQVIPSAVCFRCDICCRFPEYDSMLRPYFTAEEIHQAVTHKINPSSFPDHRGSQIEVVPHPTGEGFLCPAFDPSTQHCRIYDIRPLDCQLYPFVLMWNEAHDRVLFGWDPLCPFLLEQAEESRLPQREHPLPATPNLPHPLRERARTVAHYLESEKALATLAAHPRFITPFQPDVVVLDVLDRLTTILQSSSAAHT
jgi:uncharacterized protein